MSKHTRWSARSGIVYQTDTRYLIADCSDSIMPGDIAQQIAALPDLLEAAEALLKDYEQILDSGDCGSPYDWRRNGTEWSRMKVAIAKARGE